MSLSCPVGKKKENKISLGARILSGNGLARVPATYGPRFLLQFLSA